MRPITMVIATLCLLLLSTNALAKLPSQADVTRALAGLSDCDEEPDMDDDEDEDEGGGGMVDPCEEAMEAWSKFDDASIESAELRVLVERAAKSLLSDPSLAVRQTALELVIEGLTVDKLMKLMRAETEADIIGDIVFELGSRADEDAIAYKAAMRATRAPAAPKTRRRALRGLLVGIARHPHKAAIRKRIEEMVTTEPGPVGAVACAQLYRFGESAIATMAALFTTDAVKTKRGAMVASGCLEGLVPMWARGPRIGPKAAYDLTLKALKLKPRSEHYPKIPYALYSPLDKTMMTAPYVTRGALVDALIAVWTDRAVSSRNRISGLARLTSTLKGQPGLLKKVSRAALATLKGPFEGTFYEAQRLIKARKALGWGPKQLKALHTTYSKRVSKPKDSKHVKRNTRILKLLEEALAKQK